MKVLFCHGLETGPHGRKYHALVAAGLDVMAPDCQGLGLDDRVRLVLPLVVEHAPLLVGSSYGGAVAVSASMQCGTPLPGLVLCAPALDRVPSPERLRRVAPTIILHGVRDDVVRVEVSRQYAARTGAELIELDDDHRLSASDGRMVEAVQRLLRGRD